MLDVQGTSSKIDTNTESKEITITVSNVQKIYVDGNTKYYFQDENGNAYKIDFSTKYEDQLAFLKNGDTLTIQYIESEGIMRISALK